MPSCSQALYNAATRDLVHSMAQQTRHTHSWPRRLDRKSYYHHEPCHPPQLLPSAVSSQATKRSQRAADIKRLQTPP